MDNASTLHYLRGLRDGIAVSIDATMILLRKIEIRIGDAPETPATTPAPMPEPAKPLRRVRVKESPQRPDRAPAANPEPTAPHQDNPPAPPPITRDDTEAADTLAETPTGPVAKPSLEGEIVEVFRAFQPKTPQDALQLLHNNLGISDITIAKMSGDRRPSVCASNPAVERWLQRLMDEAAKPMPTRKHGSGMTDPELAAALRRHGVPVTQILVWHATVAARVQVARPQRACGAPCGARHARMADTGRFVLAIAHGGIPCVLLRQ